MTWLNYLEEVCQSCVSHDRDGNRNGNISTVIKVQTAVSCFYLFESSLKGVLIAASRHLIYSSGQNQQTIRIISLFLLPYLFHVLLAVTYLRCCLSEQAVIL